MMVVDEMASFTPYLCSVNDGCHCHQCLNRFMVSCVGLVAIVVKIACSLTRFLEGLERMCIWRETVCLPREY